jgi:hypothetical protein
LQKLASDAENVSNELLGLLRDLKAKEKGSKRENFRLALKSALKENQIANISRRLEKIRAQVNTNILVKMRYACINL